MVIAQLNPIKILSQTPWKRLLPLLLGVVASIAVFFLWQQLTLNEQLYIEQLIQQEAQGIELQLNKELSSRILTLQQMADRWQVSGGKTKNLWEADAKTYIDNFVGYQAIEWVDPAFVVRWIIPQIGTKAEKNIYFNQEPRRQITLKVARDLNQVIITRRIPLPKGGQGFVATVPIFVGDRFDGFIIGVFQFQTLFDSILKVPPGYKVAIYDGKELIYRQPELPSDPTLQKTVIIKAYGADWRVVVFATPELITKAKTPLPLVVLIGGLILVWLFVLVINLIQISQDQIHQLKIGNRQLQWEIQQRQQAEIHLTQLANIVESSEDAIISKDLQGVITSWNHGAEKVFGYTALEIVGKSITTLIPPEYHDEEQKIFQRILQGKSIEHYDTKRLRKDGIKIDVSVSISPVKDQAGNVIGASKIARNITESKQAEESLHHSESRYRQLINNLSVGFVIHGTDTRILLCNSMACELLGLSMDQMMGKTAIDPAWHFVQEDGTIMPIEDYPVNRVLSTQIPLKNYVLGINKLTPPVAWVLVNAFPEFDPHHQLQQVVITFIDITQLKQAEAEIQQTRNFLQALLDHLPVAVFVKDINPEQFGVFQFWNKTSERFFGISAEEAIGKTSYDFFPLEQAQFFEQKDRDTLKKGNLEDIPEEPINSLSLGKRWLHTMKIPVYNQQHQPQYLLCFSEDITERKQVETERKELIEVMENAVSGISKLDVEGRYLYVNKTYAQFAGYQPEEMIGMLWEKTVHPDELEKLIAAYWQMVKEGRVEVETIGVRKDGSIFYKQLVMIATYDEQQQLLGHYCFMKDISERAQLEAERKQAEINLERELLRTKALFNTSLDGIVVMNYQGDVVQASPSFAQMLGYTVEETLGLNVADWDAQWTPEDLEAILKSDEIVPLFETRHRRKDGSEYDVEISYSRVVLEGEIMHFSICRDISKRKQAAIDLQISQARFAGILEIASDAIISINIDQQITLFNKGAEQIFGYQAEEVLGQPLTLLMPNRFTDVHRQHIGDYAQTGGYARPMARGGIFGRRKDGSVFPAEASISKLNLNGEIIFTAFLRDITARHQAEAALHLSEERLQLALEASGDGLWDWSIETGEIYLSSRYQEMLGYKPGELVLDLNIWTQMIHPDDQSQTWECLNTHLKNSSCPYTFDYRLRCKSGEWKWIADYGKIVAYNSQGQPVRMIGTHKDISDRKQKEIALREAMEAAEQANLAKSIFLANMSHELRTPLNVILGFTQVMGHDLSLTPSQQEDLQTIWRSGDHLLNLINDVLDLSKIESGHCTLEESNFDLIGLLHSLRNMLAERASSKGLDLNFDIAPDVPQFINTDAQKLRQVLLNLLGNAIKFTHQGSITLQVRNSVSTLEVGTTTRYILQFAVIDTGVGIAPEEIDTIFDAFVQAQAGKHSVSGTGLGLTISRKLLEIMGGEISVRSTIDQGSIFSFSLPVSSSDIVEVTPEQSDRLIIGLAPGQSHHRILVVDDRIENRLLIVRLLTQLGFEVREASNGQEAVQLWQEWQPDLTWMDIRMPVLDGYEATKQIRAMESGQNSIIIALTAQASQSDRTLALAAGCNDYMSKPFREQTLFQKMAEYLGLEYCYAESIPSEPSPSLSKTLTSEDLQIMPLEWITQVHEAALDLNDYQILQLIGQIPPENQLLIEAMTSLVDNFQLEAIAIMTQI
ncbi:Multi-sensor hybrid histidine kinase (fragment) [Planktothrix serta PCC 8927]|uniref:Circadian input-output histidine kinase CikA n=1 Tax=Planktothrix serta PCC 8927 TaxID=671068 RepID=A0A7Z9C132_9CYAN